MQQPTLNFLPTDNEILEKWGLIGFLSGVKDMDAKLVLANAYEIAENILITDQINAPYQVDFVVFPILRRVLSKTKIITVDEFDNDYNKVEAFILDIIERTNLLYENCPNGFEFLKVLDIEYKSEDWEAEVVRLLCNKIIKDYSQL